MFFDMQRLKKVLAIKKSCAMMTSSIKEQPNLQGRKHHKVFTLFLYGSARTDIDFFPLTEQACKKYPKIKK